jgi:hypothetical protein
MFDQKKWVLWSLIFDFSSSVMCIKQKFSTKKHLENSWKSIFSCFIEIFYFVEMNKKKFKKTKIQAHQHKINGENQNWKLEYLMIQEEGNRETE